MRVYVLIFLGSVIVMIALAILMGMLLKKVRLRNEKISEARAREFAEYEAYGDVAPNGSWEFGVREVGILNNRKVIYDKIALRALDSEATEEDIAEVLGQMQLQAVRYNIGTTYNRSIEN